ncbi:hypothetical protein GCM10027065_32670 [Rhodanobacter koreensis]
MVSVAACAMAAPEANTAETSKPIKLKRNVVFAFMSNTLVHVNWQDWTCMERTVPAQEKYGIRHLD